MKGHLVRLLATTAFLTAIATAALAQPVPQQPPPSPGDQAYDYMINQLTVEKKAMLTQMVSLQRQVEDLTRQLVEARKLAQADPDKPKQ